MKSERKPMSKVIVIGNGIVGVSIALELAERGHKVTVIGERSRNASATLAAGAMLGCFAESTPSCITTEGGARKLRAAVNARNMWDSRLMRLEDLSGHKVNYTSNGTLVVLNAIGTQAIDTENFRAITRAAHLYGEPIESVDPTDVPWIDPEELARPLEAIFLSGEKSIDARVLMLAIDEALLALGVTVADQNGAELVLTGSHVSGVYDVAGTFYGADHIVIAAGVGTQKFIDQLGSDGRRIPPIFSGVGTSVLVDTYGLDRPSTVIRTPNRAFACGLHLVPHRSGRIYIGATNILATSTRAQPALGDLIFLLDSAVRQLNRGLQNSQIAQYSVGNRPVPVDGYPVVGNAGPENLWIASGTYRDGLHLSPVIGTAIADRIENPKHSDDLDTFTPVRRPISEIKRETVISTTVEHMIATGVETMWRTPVDWPTLVAEHIHRAFGAAAKALSDSTTPPPDVLALCTKEPRAMQMVRNYYRAWTDAN